MAETDYFKAATKDGSLKAFTSPGEPEAVLKEQEKLAAIKAEIASLEEQRDLLAATVGASTDASATDASTKNSKTKE